jgi:hypothetical protein
VPIFIRIVLVLATLVFAAATLVFLLPSLKEGYGIEELPLFLGITAPLALLAWLWRQASPGALRATALAATALPLLAYAWLDAKIAFNVWYGWHLTRQTSITSFESTPILWPGFDGPVGLHVELDLAHPTISEGNLFTPKLAMTSRRSSTANEYFTLLSEYRRVVLMPPMFPLTEATPRNVFQRRPAVHLSYDLYPSTVCRLDSPRMLCFWKSRPERPMYADGEQLAASWFFVSSGGAYADISEALSERVRTSGLFSQGTKEWIDLVGRTEPAALTRAGYQLRADSIKKDSSQDCYCR